MTGLAVVFCLNNLCFGSVLLCLPLLAHGLVMPGKAASKGDIARIKDDRAMDEWSDNYIDQVTGFFKEYYFDSAFETS